MWFAAKEAHERNKRKRLEVANREAFEAGIKVGRQIERERFGRLLSRVLDRRYGLTLSGDEIDLIIDGKAPFPFTPPPQRRYRRNG